MEEGFDIETGEPIYLHDSCPCCGREFDEIDYEYQICRYCGCHADEYEKDK